MGWLYFVVAIAAVGLVIWDTSVRGKRGRALALSVAAVAVLVGAGIAQALDVELWPLIGLLVGGSLFVLSERQADAPGAPAAGEPQPQRRR